MKKRKVVFLSSLSFQVCVRNLYNQGYFIKLPEIYIFCYVLFTMEYKDLIEKAVDGDSQAFEKLVDVHLYKLRMFSLSISGGNHDIADEILQEALIKAFLNIKGFRIQSEFTTWLWKIVRNELKMYWRKHKNWKMVSLDDLNPAYLKVESCAEKKLSDSENTELVNTLLSKLSHKLKEAVVLIDIQEMTYKDAAEVLDISVTALKSRVLKGRRNLVKFSEKIKKTTFIDPDASEECK